MTSKYAVSRLVARDISRRNFGVRRTQLLDWIEGQPDEAIASDAVLGANGYSKDINALLVEAGRIYTEAVNNDELPTDGSGLPAGGEPGQTIVLDEDVNPVWSSPSTGLFRGEWSQDQQVFIETFDAGIPSTFSKAATGVGAQMPDTMQNPWETSGKPFTQAVRCWAQPSNPVGSKSTLTLDVAALGITKPLTRVGFWVRSAYDNFPQNGKLKVYTDTGVTFFERGGNENTAWSHQFGALGPTVTQIKFEHEVVNTIGDGRSQSLFSGIELFAADQPYMSGHFVTYNGKMWKSQTNNNATTPGQSVTWLEALTLPGTAGTTGQRPSATTAGAGFSYYDTDLHKPIYSDGAVWRDAAGATV